MRNEGRELWVGCVVALRVRGRKGENASFPARRVEVWEDGNRSAMLPSVASVVPSSARVVLPSRNIALRCCDRAHPLQSRGWMLASGTCATALLDDMGDFTSSEKKFTQS